jgi:geranylgeranyl reductase family protein
MMQRFDVAIVGSGPAGAASALRLARAGFAVALIDEQRFPRAKLCGEYLNPGAMRELEGLGMRPELDAHAVALHGMRLFAHGEMAEFCFSSHAWSIPRKVLDDRIRAAALRAGVQPVHGRVRGLSIADSGVSVRVAVRSEEEVIIQARFVVGADGMRSSVARICKLTVPSREQRFAIGGHYSEVVPDNWIEIYDSPGGYLTISPVGSRSSNAVFVMSKDRLARNASRLDEALAEFSNGVSKGRRIIDSATLQGTRLAIGPLSHGTLRPVTDKVLLVGDAAAFVDPFTGQGVYLALSSARAAADAIERALRAFGDERAAWFAYEAAQQSLIRERKRLALIVNMLLKFGFIARWTAVTMRSRPYDFNELVDAVCGTTRAPSLPELALSLAKVLR